jgi:hypothetical protein
MAKKKKKKKLTDEEKTIRIAEENVKWWERIAEIKRNLERG